MSEEAQEGEVLEPEDAGEQLSIGIKTSVITGAPSGVQIKIGSAEHVTDPNNAIQIGLAIIRAATMLDLQAQSIMQARAEQAMARKSNLVGPTGSPLL